MFITVSLSTSGNPVLINTDNILYINQFGICTEFHLKNSSHTIIVREPFDVLSRIIYEQQISKQAYEELQDAFNGIFRTTGLNDDTLIAKAYNKGVIDCKEILRSKYYRDDNYRGENRNG